MFNFEEALKHMSGQTVLCVGDLMLDEFVYGEVSRVSPEAPAPVIAVQRSETNVGGAGNVARNIASLGGRCIFVGLVGEDEAGAKLKAGLAQEARIEAVLVSDAGRPTTRKVRFVSEHFSTHMLRADYGGDNKPSARNGTAVNVYDRFGIENPGHATGMEFEAAWGPDGAICVAHPRIADNISLEELAHRYPHLRGRLGPQACYEQRMRLDPRALLFNESMLTWRSRK